jgi:hypothetical protein
MKTLTVKFGEILEPILGSPKNHADDCRCIQCGTVDLLIQAVREYNKAVRRGASMMSENEVEQRQEELL